MRSEKVLEEHDMLTVRRVLAATAIFTSAFLLFTVEPLFAKRILPWFGGSAAVWSTCLVFYQTALLLGYLYARVLTRYAKPLTQAVVHITLLLLSLILLPIGPSDWWQPVAGAPPIWQPTWKILIMLSATLGLPFVALSATSPLVQYWLARTGEPAPYRLFALSNFASLAALLGYPILIEPSLDILSQRVWWSVGFGGFVALCGGFAFLSRSETSRMVSDAKPEPLPIFRRFYWFSLSACGSMLLLSVTNHITQNVAAVPLLWVLPLAIYLLSFVFGFGAGSFYQRGVWLRLLALALGLLAYSVYNIDAIDAMEYSLPIFLGGLFVCLMFCQGELYLNRPEISGLTDFYLVIAAGGAAGAIFVGLVAPSVFDGVYELPFTLFAIAVLALVSTLSSGWPLRILWVGVVGCMAAVFVANVKAYHENSLLLVRNFYGSLRVVQSPHAGPEQTRTLFHGTIQHGAEFLWADRQRRPLTYYGRDSGIGIVLRECLPDTPRRVGVVGLGTGTLAAFGLPGDTFVFYELNPQVITIANALFYFIRQSPAHVEIVEGDARLSLQREHEPFDLLVLDAFSGDAIPVHLLTRESLALYLRLLKPNGVIAFHVSNHYLALAPIVQQLANQAGYQAVQVTNHDDPDNSVFAADWVLVTNNPAVLDNAAIRLHSSPIEKRDGLRPWTDSFNNLIEIVRWSNGSKPLNW
jgi:SAM-dependent methyltransferase